MSIHEIPPASQGPQEPEPKTEGKLGRRPAHFGKLTKKEQQTKQQVEASRASQEIKTTEKSTPKAIKEHIGTPISKAVKGQESRFRAALQKGGIEQESKRPTKPLPTPPSSDEEYTKTIKQQPPPLPPVPDRGLKSRFGQPLPPPPLQTAPTTTTTESSGFDTPRTHSGPGVPPPPAPRLFAPAYLPADMLAKSILKSIETQRKYAIDPGDKKSIAEIVNTEGFAKNPIMHMVTLMIDRDSSWANMLGDDARAYIIGEIPGFMKTVQDPNFLREVAKARYKDRPDLAKILRVLDASLKSKSWQKLINLAIKKSQAELPEFRLIEHTLRIAFDAIPQAGRLKRYKFPPNASAPYRII